MNINFDTASLKREEAHALIAYLSDFFALSTPGQNIAPAPTTEEQAIFGVPHQSTPADAPQAQSTTGPTLVPETTTRKRRTKAEIAADEAATKAAAEAAPVTTEAAPIATPSALPTTKLSADELRTLLNAYIAKYSMEKALEVLGAFECSRVSEALELEPVKFSALVAALNG